MKELEETIARTKASSKATEEFLEKHKSYGNLPIEKEKKKSSNLNDTLGQIFLGNYTDKITVAGTVAQIGIGVIGIDFPADIRDISAEIVNWEWTWGHVGKTALDIASIPPGFGAAKSFDEVAELAKGEKKQRRQVKV